MNRVVLDTLVGKVDRYVQDICRSNNEGMDEDRQWMYVRVAALLPIEDSDEVHSMSDIPEGTTHCLITGIYTWNEGSSNTLPIDAVAFPVSIQGDTGELSEDVIDEYLGGGPILQGSTVQECIEWMSDMGYDDYIIEYYELSDGYIHVCIDD